MVLQKVAGPHTRRKCHNIPLPDRNSAAPWTAQQNKSKISKYFGSRNPQIDRNVFPGCKRWMCIVHNFQVSKFIINLGVSIVYERCTTCPFTRKGHGWSKWSSAVWIVNHACVKLYLVLISGWPRIDCEASTNTWTYKARFLYLPLTVTLYTFLIFFVPLICRIFMYTFLWLYVNRCQQEWFGIRPWQQKHARRHVAGLLTDVQHGIQQALKRGWSQIAYHWSMKVHKHYI